MSLFNNEKFTIYRDADLEAFYNVDLKNRRKIILAHIIIHLFPVMMTFLITRVYSLDTFNTWLIVFSLILYVIVVIETVSYLFPTSRAFYKKYFLWILLPIGFLIGIGGFFAGTDLLHYTQEQNTDFNTTFIQILVGGIGVFTLFGISQFGLSQILYASKSLYTKKAKAEADIQFATEIQKRILQEVLIEHQNIRAYASSFPANELGGDFFELSLHDNELFASIGDHIRAQFRSRIIDDSYKKCTSDPS